MSNLFDFFVLAPSDELKPDLREALDAFRRKSARRRCLLCEDAIAVFAAVAFARPWGAVRMKWIVGAVCGRCAEGPDLKDRVFAAAQGKLIPEGARANN